MQEITNLTSMLYKVVLITANVLFSNSGHPEPKTSPRTISHTSCFEAVIDNFAKLHCALKDKVSSLHQVNI
jgi:hypothetical protein